MQQAGPIDTVVERFRSGVCLHTSRAFDVLSAGRPGDTITREEMADKTGRDCSPTGSGYGNVQSAIKMCEREKGIVWRWVKALNCWKCLTEPERVGETSKEIGCGFRRVGRGLRVAATVNPKNLDQDTRREHTLNCAIAGVMRTMGHGSTRKRLAEVSDKLTEPDVGKVLALMQK